MSSHAYKRQDLCFIMNLRDKATKSTMSVPEIAEIVGGVTEEERQFLDMYINIPEENIRGYEEEGWFEKTYETVKKHAEAYCRTTPGITSRSIIYTPNHGTTSARIRIARLLWFYEGKGCKIPLSRINLAEEQEFVVNQIEGITIVNSGPGTGKTTTAAHKTARLIAMQERNEDNLSGVLVVSYTNAAVDNLQTRLLELINNAEEISRKSGKKIWLTTIDSLSQMLLPKGQKKTDFDAQIEAAIRDSDQFASLFLTLDNRPAYSHMILDEAQDVSNERYQLLRMIYVKYGFKSFTIIGDPRQRLNIRHGGFYQDLLMRGITIEPTELQTIISGGYELGETIGGSFERPFVVKYHQTYRFINPLLLDLANIMSAKRPAIHSQLVESEYTIMGDRSLLVKFSSFEQIAADIISRIYQGTKTTSICIISPVTQKASKTKTKFDAIRQILASNGLMTSDQYGADAIYTSSIQSVKGLEFDHVYFIGASGYPTYMNQEYQDINDGISMNFVANTRARYSITYLTDESIRAPDDVPESMTVGGEAKQVTYNREIYPEAIATDGIEVGDYRKFMAHNMLAVPHEEVPNSRFSTEGHPENFLYEIISAVLAHNTIKGKNTMIQLPNEVVPMEDIKYRDYVRRGMIYDMRGKNRTGTTIFLSQSQIPFMGLLRSEYDETNIEAHKAFKECITSRSSQLTNMTQINDVIMKVVNLIRSKGWDPSQPDKANQSVIMERIRATSITTHTSIIIFSECLYLGALIKKRNPGKQVFLIGLSSGMILKIGDTPKPLKQYEYMVGGLFSITIQFRLIRGRARFSLASIDQNVPQYFIDTEFTPRTWNKGATIYDIAMINGFDPYASIVTYLYPDTFSPYLNPDIRLSDLEGAPTVDDFYAFFSHLVSASRRSNGTNIKPIIWYFSASHDISPFYEQHEYYDRAKELGVEAIEKTWWKYNPNLDYKFSFRNAREGNSKGTMSELYENLLRVKVDSYKHILLHTAVSDALLLAEFIMTRDFGN